MTTNSVVQVLAYCTANGRVCPMPSRWHGLWELLSEHGDDPPLPLILGPWYVSDSEKAYRLRQHVEFAAEHGVLDQVAEYLLALFEDDWYYVDGPRR